MSDAAIAVDLGGTNIRAALVTRDGQIRHLVTRPTRAGEGVDAVVDRIVALVSEVVVHEQAPSDVGIGMVAPGPLNPTTGVIYFAPNLPGWHDVPLRAILQEKLDRAVVIGNDGNSAALGEALFGAAKGIQHLIYLALGTGIGGGIVSHGRLIEGTRGVGGEVGHMPIDSEGPRCHCGGVGCVESYAGGWAIARDGELAARAGRSSALADAAGGKPMSAKIVADVARAGDPAAREILARAGRALGIGLAGLVNVFDPQMIVVGGGLAEIGDLLLTPMREALPRYAMPQIYPDASIQRSALGTDTGIFGAAARVFYMADHGASVFGN